MHKHNLTGNLIDNKLPLDLVLSSDENAKVSKELTLDEEALALQFLVLLDGPSTWVENPTLDLVNEQKGGLL